MTDGWFSSHKLLSGSPIETNTLCDKCRTEKSEKARKENPTLYPEK
jgi:hypothetical protein